MPLRGASRWFLSAALAHLAVAAGLVLLDARTAALTVRWNAFLWLLLVGFLSCTTFGFSLHLFPVLSSRRLPGGPGEAAVYGLAEASVLVGAVGLYAGKTVPSLAALPSLAGGLLVASVAGLLALFGLASPRSRAGPPTTETRPGDAVTVPLFLTAWAAAGGAGGLFALSGASDGPGYGWWLAGVHLLVLGHATVLVAAVSLRLVPRSVSADPPRAAVLALAVLAPLGAVLVPAGMLVVRPSDGGLLDLLAAPEAAFAVLLVGVLAVLGARARSLRPQFGLELASALLLLLGGGVGLWMVYASSYELFVAHAFVNVLGFVGLMILVMWFGMIAPFQRVSHAWTRRMLWGLAVGWLLALAALALAGGSAPAEPGAASTVGGGLLLAVALGWGIGTIPVLFPALNPLPGISVGRLREMRERRRPR